MNFTDIEGHERPIGILKRALANDTLAHAYLFSGQDGIGKKLAATALAAAVNCPDRRDNGGCGVCPSCRKVAAGSHPDVHFLSADGDEIKIDQIRKTQAEFALKPFEGAAKVLIVDNAETLNTAAANAFLKTLEEPPGNTLIILISPMPHSLLQTIRSRCQEVRFQPLPRKTLARALQSRRGLAEEDARFAAALSQGSFGRALAVDVGREKDERALFLELFFAIPGMTDEELLGLAETMGKDRERFEHLLDRGEEFLRDVIVYGVTGDERLLVYPEGGAACRDYAEAVSLAKTLADGDLIRASRTMLDRRTGAQLVAENLLLGLAGKSRDLLG